MLPLDTPPPGDPIGGVVCLQTVWKLVADIEGGMEAEGVWEHGVEESIWT